ncbi:MAG: hypothetical protein HRK26_05470 [Rickettsiaceae bacterium H1]|nr:hypothetical protein [Rickettsiaceae bacterium H1]
MTRFISIILVIITFFLIGYFALVKYVKRDFINWMYGISRNMCQISFEDSSIKPVSFPFNFIINLEKPTLSCTFENNSLQKSYNLKVFTRNISSSFGLFDKNVTLKIPDKIRVSNGNEITFCTGFNDVRFLLTDNVFSRKKNNFHRLSYDNDGIRCVDLNNREVLHDISIDLRIDYNELRMNKVDLLVNNKHYNSENSVTADVDLSFGTNSKNSESTVDIRKFAVKSGDFSMTMLGDLSFKGLINGKMVINIDKYDELLDKLHEIGYDKEFILGILNKCANQIDQENFSIVLQNIGKEFYIGKESIMDFSKLVSIKNQ